jgi:hypothetical protein
MGRLAGQKKGLIKSQLFFFLLLDSLNFKFQTNMGRQNWPTEGRSEGKIRVELKLGQSKAEKDKNFQNSSLLGKL